MNDARAMGRTVAENGRNDLGPDLRQLEGMLGEVARSRPPDGREPPVARLLRGWRRRRLLARLERAWPGGFCRQRSGDLVYVPRPLDRRGREALLRPPAAHPAALAQLRPGAVAIEAGAGLGLWAVPLARAVGAAGRLLATEPLPRDAAALAKTLAANGLRQAVAIGCAIGAADGKSDQHCGAVLRSLDSLVAEHRLYRLDLLRIAAAGEARGALDGAADTLERFRPVLVLAIGGEADGERAAIHYRLRGLGYRIVGILLEDGMAEAGWAAYTAGMPPFRPGDRRDLLLVPEGS